MADDDNAKTCKVVLLGESGVGKTCIIARFINNTFEDNIMSTTGASYAGKTMTFDEYDGKSIKFEIWDTAGQEKYRALTKIFYKDASVAILVYDITRKESFEEIQKYWYNQLKEYAQKNISKKKFTHIILFIFCNFSNWISILVIGLAANKSDLFDKEQVSEVEAREYANQIGAIFKLTSACSGGGIEDLFKSVGCKYLDPNYKDEGSSSGNSNNANNAPVRLNRETAQNNNNTKKKGCC